MASNDNNDDYNKLLRLTQKHNSGKPKSRKKNIGVVSKDASAELSRNQYEEISTDPVYAVDNIVLPTHNAGGQIYEAYPHRIGDSVPPPENRIARLIKQEDESSSSDREDLHKKMQYISLGYFGNTSQEMPHYNYNQNALPEYNQNALPEYNQNALSQYSRNALAEYSQSALPEHTGSITIQSLIDKVVEEEYNNPEANSTPSLFQNFTSYENSNEPIAGYSGAVGSNEPVASYSGAIAKIPTSRNLNANEYESDNSTDATDLILRKKYRIMKKKFATLQKKYNALKQKYEPDEV